MAAGRKRLYITPGGFFNFKHTDLWFKQPASSMSLKIEVLLEEREKIINNVQLQHLKINDQNGLL